ncbi:SDR family NAD(P)-dependent oxidoreductase [Rhodococcus tukisamuensis]|uniref:3-oxoacyl-[acyl-carrier-protein] reductase MabA n=1 Tax=Rhodococcus tukisamuensis TaxID=168276 RepID=A0A1G7D713_9NOCA|nr:SDR family oxidoreductase [Rhodococcus tukisamuensis]SDE47303.1 3-oxoacyl-[acyl-carrier protein] reductase [Rhodococcus tukisamuensis]
MGDQQRTAVVTGGGGGIGSAISRRLAADGFDVVIAYCANESGAEDAAHDCRESGVRAVTVQADLTEPEGVRLLVDTAVDEFGRLDAFVHNAATAVFGSLPKLATQRHDDYLQVFALNAHALLVAAAECSQRMADGGRIVNISSVATVQGLFGGAAYAASKAAAESITRTAASELGGRGITCNTIQLGLVDTATARAVTNQQVIDFYAMQAPVRRVGEPSEVAALVSHLVGGESGWLTGQTIGLNGGFRF